MAIHEIDAGDDVAAVFAGGAAGDEYHFDPAGPHRITGPVTLRNGDVLTSPTPYGARLTGAIEVIGWSKVAARGTSQWVASVPNFAEKANSELFFSTVEQPKRRQASQSAVAPGSWFYDTSANKIYVGDDPQGDAVELSIAKRAIHTNATNLLIEHLIIEKCTNGKQEGMLESTNGAHAAWTMKYLDVRYSNGTGLRFPGAKTTATRCRFRWNSQIHVVGGENGTPGAGLFFCEFAYGNYFDRYSIGHEAGSIKIVNSHDFTIANCWSHHNQGPGFWIDINNWNYLVENCIAEDERWMGYYFEIGHDGTVRNNLARRCALAVPASDNLWDVVWAGFAAAASHDIEMSGNVVEDCPQGYIGFQQSRDEYQPEAGRPYHNPAHWSGDNQTFDGPHEEGAHRVWNLNVHGNTYARATNGHCGIAADCGGNSLLDLTRTNAQNNDPAACPYPSERWGSNRWSGNHYYLGDGSPSQHSFFWTQADMKTWQEWQALGQDAGGSYQGWSDYTPSTLTRPPGWDEDTTPPIVEPPPTTDPQPMRFELAIRGTLEVVVIPVAP